MQREPKVHVANKGSHLKVILKWLPFCLLLVSLESFVYTSQINIDRIRATRLKSSELLYLPYHKKMKMFTLGFNEIMGDILYIRANNNMGIRHVQYTVADTLAGPWSPLKFVEFNPQFKLQMDNYYNSNFITWGNFICNWCKKAYECFINCFRE